MTPTCKLPPCPKCEEFELYRLPGTAGKPNTLEVRCYLCGWSSGPLDVLDGWSESDAIADRVDEARAARRRATA